MHAYLTQFLSNFRIQLLTLTLLLCILGTNCELTESVIFQPIDDIQTSKSSWIFSTAVDFTPYLTSLNSVFDYGMNVKETVIDFKNTFYNQHKKPHKRYQELLDMTIDDMDLAINEITHMQTEASNLIDHISNRHKRSLLPFGGLFNFLFGTADDKDLKAMKSDIQQLYQNQINQADVLNDIISITNVSRGLINENIQKINNIVDTIISLNQTIRIIEGHLEPLYVARKFTFMHTEFISHHTKIRMITRQIADDINLIRSYLSTFTSGKITPEIIDPKHLRHELIKIHKQLPPKLTLPENPKTNIWHYYKFLTVTPVIDGNQLILMVRIPLLDTDSSMTLYKVYNLPIYNPTIGKSLKYNLEGSNLAVTKDNNYVTILSEAEFIQCTLAQGHFCSLNTALYHVDYSKLCLVAMFLKQNDRINKDCQLAVTNITGPQAIYLDQGLWAISIDKSTQMEIRCPKVTQVKSLKPPITFVNLQPACSAFSPGVKLPPYFKQYSKGFHVAFKSANLNVPKYKPTNFRIWNTFNLSNISPIESEKLKKLDPSPTIPIDQLRAKIASFRHINTDKNPSWIIVGSGTGSGFLLLIVICGCLYWRCKNHQCLNARSPVPVTYTDPENPNMMHTSVDAIRSGKCSDLGRETVGIQVPVSNMDKVVDERLQHAFTEAVLDQLAANGADVKRHHRKLREQQNVALPAIEY